MRNDGEFRGIHFQLANKNEQSLNLAGVRILYTLAGLGTLLVGLMPRRPSCNAR